MAVNLEELAMKSIEQYAAFSVRLSSMESALTDMNRRNEVKEEKFIAACDKLARLEEKLSTTADDRSVIHKRIDEAKVEIQELDKAVKAITGLLKEHHEDHCDGCVNVERMHKLEDEVTVVKNVDKDLKEVRRKVTSAWGLTFIRFIASRWGQIFVALLFADLLLDFFAHYDVIKNLWSWIHFQPAT